MRHAAAQPPDDYASQVKDLAAARRRGAASISFGRQLCANGYFFFAPLLGPNWMAAWAAARRAIGTRNGEQLT
jgi:hypothetical protein